jgi:hydroxypyruvate isomerase
MITRRDLIKQTAGATAALAIGGIVQAQTTLPARAISKGRINQTVCRWCYGKTPLDELAENCKAIGLKGIDLCAIEDFETLKKHGLVSTMTHHPAVGIEHGLNRVENHEKLAKPIRDMIQACAIEGFPNVICFSGNRAGMADDEGMKNCEAGIKKFIGFAEEKKITVCMELLNSKHMHKDYMCDKSDWGVELCNKVGSENFKLLYDIFHMQQMEGDIIDTIRKNGKYFAHYHTGGVPGRGDIDDTQELNYAPIMRAIAESGFKGYVAHEFRPSRGYDSLAAAAKLCDV